ncbi:hypothetical protein BC826DRAFT_985970 [Russula brevipes]|nr:hypothetical protein BC826DRAFT_985970 [Russula brevipes]
MTNFRDPKVEQADALAFVKLLHVVGGIYIWEFVTSLWFEWQIITGQRKYRWTVWLYSGCRLSALFAVILIFIGFDTTRSLNCKLWLIFVYFFAYLSFVFASALILLRVIAIWEKNIIVTTIAVAAWLVNIIFYVRNIAMAVSVWNSAADTCLVLHTRRGLTPVTITLVEDVVLLVLMLTGLRRYGEAGMYGLWRLLYRQGLFWLALVTVAEIPSTVLIILDLNDYFNLMFQTPELIMMTIGASRIYRSLADYTCMTEFNWNDEKSWAIMGGALSDSSPPGTTIRFQETQCSLPQLGGPEMSRPEAYTIEVSQTMDSGKRDSCTTTDTAGTDSPV